jgi:hypothetical protein
MVNLFVHHVTSRLTYSMEQSPSWEANWFAASQEIPRILWNPNVHYRIHKSPPPLSILNQLNLVHSSTSHFLKIHLNIILPSVPESAQWSLSLRLLRSYQSISPGPRLCRWVFRNKNTFSMWRVVSPSPNPQAEGQPLVGCPWQLIQYIHSYPPYWIPFLHPQPEDAPCRGDRDPLITWQGSTYHMTRTHLSHDRDPLVTWQWPTYHMTGTHLSHDKDPFVTWQGPTCHITVTHLSHDKDPLVTWQGPTYHMTRTHLSHDRDPLITWATIG